MKKFTLLSFVLIVMMIITPLISVRYARVDVMKPSAETEYTDSSIVKVMSSDNGFIKSVDTREYLIGSVAGEMPASFHQEALKAQAVACYTYAEYISKRDSDKLGGADISDDSTVYQSYIDESKRKEKWGDNFSENEEIIANAVDAVLYEYISLDNQPILAAYHNMCSGTTESAENIWGKKIEYLVSVASAGDKLSPDFESKTTYSIKEFKEKLSVISAEIGKIERLDSGVVKKITVGDKTFTGSQFRDLLSLKSSDFDVNINEESVTIVCRGNGHFVGMSQYGADYMARQGSNYKEILMHYYPETEISSLKN